VLSYEKNFSGSRTARVLGMNTTTKGISEALDVLVDYPRIEEIVNIKVAQRFLKFLEKSGVSEIPEIDDDMEDLVAQISNSFETSIEDWEDALRKLPINVYAWSDNSDEDKENGKIISGAFSKDLIEFQDENFPHVSYSFSFNADNIANIVCFEDESRNKEGTWLEVYSFLVKYCQEHLQYPEIPE
jgi:hypothetical protein